MDCSKFRTPWRLCALVASARYRSGPWFIADNLITFGHTRGFLTDPRFVAAVTSEQPSPDELSLAWRTHTLCWAAESCSNVPGILSNAAPTRVTPWQSCFGTSPACPAGTYLYDLFDPTGGTAKASGCRRTRRPVRACGPASQRYDNVTVTRGKVPDVLAEIAPQRIAFLHIDMNNAEAERGALEVLFDRSARAA